MALTANGLDPNLNKLYDYDIFLFDVDDTLLYTFENGFHKVNAAAKACGYSPVSFEQYKACYGNLPFPECLATWFPGCNVLEMSNKYDSEKKQFPYKPICDFGKLQEQLYKRGIKCGILTNGKHNEKLYEKLSCVRAEVSDLIGIWGQEDIPCLKPDPRALEPVKHLWPKAKIVYFGDSIRDYNMCKAGNVRFVQVLSGKEETIQDVLSIRDISVLLECL